MFKSPIKLWVLKELSMTDLSGYDLIKSIGLVGGQKPSAGYIYPLLNELTEKGYVSCKNQERKKIYHLTANGKKFLKKMQENYESMQKGMVKVLDPILERSELEDYVKFQKEMGEHKHYLLKNLDMLWSLHRSLFPLYKIKKVKAQKEYRSIILKTIKQLEKIQMKYR